MYSSHERCEEKKRRLLTQLRGSNPDGTLLAGLTNLRHGIHKCRNVANFALMSLHVTSSLHREKRECFLGKCVRTCAKIMIVDERN